MHITASESMARRIAERAADGLETTEEDLSREGFDAAQIARYRYIAQSRAVALLPAIRAQRCGKVLILSHFRERRHV